MEDDHNLDFVEDIEDDDYDDEYEGEDEPYDVNKEVDLACEIVGENPTPETHGQGQDQNNNGGGEGVKAPAQRKGRGPTRSFKKPNGRDKSVKLQKKFGSAWSWFCNYSSSHRGRLWVAGYMTRLPLWDGISSLGVVSGPWLVIGDFNSVPNSYDRINGNVVTNYEVNHFRSFVDNLDLCELISKGSFYSWSNKGHGDTRIATRIDRGLVNQAWLNSHVESIYLPPLLSNHNPLLVENLKSDKKNLKDLNTKYFANVDEKVDVALASLKAIQDQLAVDYSNSDLHVKEAEAVNMVKHWMYIQESIYKQKSRVDWIKLADCSSHYFFSVMKHKQGRNRIDSFFTEDDVLLKDHVLIENEIVGFNKGLLGSSASSLPAVDLATIRRGSQLSSSSIDILTAVVTTSEIDNALTQIGDDKAPGIDGFNVVFFKKAWPTIKTDIYAAIFCFFETGVIDKNCRIWAK
ncbi:uncharacterized protein LOC110697529 [Chenopodium quinoa]|uniref:uncharacterized protein LOC110697529 n=1 Tax=Chenopodium quinoa TaxID=63459 RepID=UPI000B791D8D|nr:uncharacterized protein LOC110697529 [Chenopodium quinoa]